MVNLQFLVDDAKCFETVRRGIMAARPAEILKGVVECDEVYVTAGHKGQPAVVAKKAARAGAAV